MDLKELREKAKAKGVKNSSVKGEERLLKELEELEEIEELIKPVDIKEETLINKELETPEADIKRVLISESEVLQKQGWVVIGITLDGHKTIHTLKRVS